MPSRHYERARGLFQPFDYQVVVRAVIEKTSPGKIWVDDTMNPLSGFMATTEGWFLAGRTCNQEFNQGLRRLVRRTILEGDYYSPVNPEFLHELFFHIDSDEWVSQFDYVFDVRHPLPTHRIHFTCEEVTLDWRETMPEGYELLKVDQELDTSALQFPEDIRQWIAHSLDDQRKRGFGMCLVHGNTVIVWINADCASGDECEIGIITTENYRRRGLGSLTAAAAVEQCLSSGYSRVGWHCEDHNYGSMATAQKVGFVKERDYVHYICMFDEAEHHAESGMRHYYDCEYESAISDFEASLQIGEPPVWAHVLEARCYAKTGNSTRALKSLQKAQERGWRQWDSLVEDEDFRSLFTPDEWNNFLTSLKRN
jgi:RimJ/RimL family protein N-acetyltransferase